MKVLWVINQCIPAIARDLNIEVPNKEGWLTGLSERILEDKDNKIELSVFSIPITFTPVFTRILP